MLVRPTPTAPAEFSQPATTTREGSPAAPASTALVPPTVASEIFPGAPHPGPAAFSWAQLESTNYADYIKNLRAIQCPEETIRDIVSADLRATLERQRRLRSPGAAASAHLPTPAEEAERFTAQLLGQRATFAGRPAPGVPGTPMLSPAGGTILGRGAFPAEVLSPSAPEASLAQTRGEGVRTSDVEIPRDEDEPPTRDRRAAIADLVRSRYGVEALLSWQREAIKEGSSLEGLLQARNIWIPVDRLAVSPAP
ncbi:MAG: hypothetical protein HYR88_02415 [Verrucomicrobia bacterium]|nr:hypothetical protein [Verrucomicrobiota bacterium]